MTKHVLTSTSSIGGPHEQAQGCRGYGGDACISLTERQCIEFRETRRRNNTLPVVSRHARTVNPLVLHSDNDEGNRLCGILGFLSRNVWCERVLQT